MYGAFFIMMLTASVFFIWAEFATDENIPGCRISQLGTA